MMGQWMIVSSAMSPMKESNNEPMQWDEKKYKPKILDKFWIRLYCVLEETREALYALRKTRPEDDEDSRD